MKKFVKTCSYAAFASLIAILTLTVLTKIDNNFIKSIDFNVLIGLVILFFVALLVPMLFYKKEEILVKRESIFLYYPIDGSLSNEEGQDIINKIGIEIKYDDIIIFKHLVSNKNYTYISIEVLKPISDKEINLVFSLGIDLAQLELLELVNRSTNNVKP